MTEEGYKFYIGIDISKENIDIAKGLKEEVLRLSNDEIGWKKLIKEITFPTDTLVVMEASGGYERGVAHFLQKKGVNVSIVNAKRVRDFAKASGTLAKTDKIDARLIQRYGAVFNPRLWVAGSELEQTLDAHIKRRAQLVKMRSSEKQHLSVSSGAVKKEINKHIKLLDKMIQDEEGRIEDLLKSDEELQGKVEKLMGIQGVGKTTASTVIVSLPELGKLSPKEISALAGLAPFNNESGKSEKKRQTWGGRAQLRGALYMAILSGVRYNPVLREFYERLTAKGKTAKVAMVACMRKLLVMMNAMIRDNAEWAPYASNVARQ